jgi:hypothetical protein
MSLIKASVACWVKVVGRKELMAVVSWMFKAGAETDLTV